MCTRVMWPDAAGSVLVGRNMDYHRDTGTNLWSLPRGIERNDGVGGSLRWTSKYGSVVAGAFDMMSVDGINEAGLSGHVLWLTESEYGTFDKSRPALSMAIWLQYFLDNFATVADAVAWIDETKVQVVPLGDPATGEVPAVHLALDDATGDSAIVEYVDGGVASVWHDRSYRVMTNSPTYDKQIEMLQEVAGFGGDKPLPGTTQASDRFARAAHYVGHLPEPKTRVEAVAGMFSVIRNAAQPFRVPEPGKPYSSQTIWQTVADLTNRQFVFSSTTRPNVVWVNLAELDFGEGASARKLDLIGDTALEGGLGGNVTGRFTDTAPMQFLELVH
ncbi:linear amide C-N hydrolase [Prescottella soli]|uniref:Linear amide C-N hydrolase n=1 Tax=Prescottella soli TaxID=1543852 RepID=A0ABW9FSY1_9NOCA